MDEQHKPEYVHFVCKARGLLDFDPVEEIAQGLVNTYAYDHDNFEFELVELIAHSETDLHSMKALVLLKRKLDELIGFTLRPLAQWYESYCKRTFRRPRGRPSEAVRQQLAVSTMHELAEDLNENLTRNDHPLGDYQPTPSYKMGSVADMVGVELGIPSIKTLGRMVTRFLRTCGCFYCCPPQDEQEEFFPDESTWKEIREATELGRAWLASND